jgi:hypothetical protein
MIGVENPPVVRDRSCRTDLRVSVLRLPGVPPHPVKKSGEISLGDGRILVPCFD